MSYHYHKLEEVGAHRALGLKEFLPHYGWTVDVLTARRTGDCAHSDSSVVDVEFEPRYPDVVRVLRDRFGVSTDLSFSRDVQVESDPRFGRKTKFCIRLIKEASSIPVADRRWCLLASMKARHLFSARGYDAIITTSGPAATHFVGAYIKSRFRVPWIADLRDLWSQNHDSHFSRVRGRIEEFTEKTILRRADALVTVSESLAESLREMHNGKRVYSILNGFNPSIRVTSPDTPREFTISYTGFVYRSRQRPEVLLEALANLKSRGQIAEGDFRVDFYGRSNEWLNGVAERYSLSDAVRVHGLVSRSMAIEVQRRSQILLMLTWHDAKMGGLYSAKLFEYMAASRPILAIGGSRAEVEALLNRTGSGVFAGELKEVEDHVQRFYDEYRKTGFVRFRGVKSEIDKFSQLRMAEEFAQILNSLSNLGR